MRSRKGLLRGLGLVALAVALVAAGRMWRQTAVDPSLVAVVKKGALTVEITATGTLKPIQSITYRSPLVGRDAEIIELAPEGTHVAEGDLVVRLDTTEIELDVERVQGELRQMQLDLQVAEGERQDAAATLRSVADGEGALTVQEVQTRLQLSEHKAERLRKEYQQLEPLLSKGFITRDELARTASALEEAEEELGLARKRADVATRLTHPREKQRAMLQLAQRESQVANARARLQDAQARLVLLQALIEQCRVPARRPGLVVYEESLTSNPRRKIRVGDRVTSSQGLVTIPEVNRMLVETSVSEAEVHRLRPGQPAVVRLEAFPSARLSGKVVRIGTLASASADRPFEHKRFDLIIELDPSTTELRPEMTARADIAVGTRDDVLLIPVNAVFEQAGGFAAFVVGRSGTERRPIELGESNGRFVEVKAGLSENQRVVLTEPGAAPASEPAPRSDPRERGNAVQPR